MSRSVPEWIGKTDDAKIPDRVRVRVFMRSSGGCAVCGRKVVSGEKWECDHIVALANGGENREINLQTLCGQCHREKTNGDVAAKAKTYAIQKRNLGLRKPKGRPIPGSKASGWKRKINGGWERR